MRDVVQYIVMILFCKGRIFIMSFFSRCTVKRALSVLLALVLVCACMLPAIGCSGSLSEFPVEVNGVKFDEAPQKVICMSNSFLEIIYGLGYQSQLIGRSFSSTLEDAADLTPCGVADNPATDSIIGLEPDLVLTDLTTPAEALETMTTAGLRVLVMDDAHNRRELVALYENLGQIFGGSTTGKEKGAKLIEGFLIQMDDIERIVSVEEDVTVCIMLDSTLTHCATGDTLTSMLIELAGGFNVAIQGTEETFSINDIARADPEVLLAPEEAMSTIYAKREIQQIYAMENQGLYTFDTTIFDLQYDNMITAVWQLAHILHPDIITKEMLPPDAVMPEKEDNSVMTKEEYDAWKAELEAAENADE